MSIGRAVREPLAIALWSCVAWIGSLGLTGCAGGRGGEPDPTLPPPGEDIVIPITVVNDVSPGTNITVRFISLGGTRILGSVGPGRERTFQVGSPSMTGRFRLNATGPALGQEITSQAFSLFPNSTVRWTLIGNQLVVGEHLGERMQPKNQ